MDHITVYTDVYSRLPAALLRLVYTAFIGSLSVALIDQSAEAIEPGASNSVVQPILLRETIVSGNTVISDDAIRAVSGPYLGSEITVATIVELKNANIRRPKIIGQQAGLEMVCFFDIHL